MYSAPNERVWRITHLAKLSFNRPSVELTADVFQTALWTRIRRLAAHPASALNFHPREIQAPWSHNHDTGIYDTLYQVDNSSNDVVIYWTMIGTHAVPDRQHDGHTPITSCKRTYDTWCKYFIPNRSFNECSKTSHTQRPRWLFILERYKLCDHITTTQAAMIRCIR